MFWPIQNPNFVGLSSTGHITTSVDTYNDGWREFMCIGGKVSVWLTWSDSSYEYVIQKYKNYVDE